MLLVVPSSEVEDSIRSDLPPGDRLAPRTKSTIPEAPAKKVRAEASTSTWPVRSMVRATFIETIRLWREMMKGSLT